MSATTPVTISPPEGRPGFLRRTSWWVLLLATTVGLVAASAAAAVMGRHLSQSGWSSTVVVASGPAVSSPTLNDTTDRRLLSVALTGR